MNPSPGGDPTLGSGDKGRRAWCKESQSYAACNFDSRQIENLGGRYRGEQVRRAQHHSALAACPNAHSHNSCQRHREYTFLGVRNTLGSGVNIQAVLPSPLPHARPMCCLCGLAGRCEAAAASPTPCMGGVGTHQDQEQAVAAVGQAGRGT